MFDVLSHSGGDVMGAWADEHLLMQRIWTLFNLLFTVRLEMRSRRPRRDPTALTASCRLTNTHTHTPYTHTISRQRSDGHAIDATTAWKNRIQTPGKSDFTTNNWHFYAQAEQIRSYSITLLFFFKYINKVNIV